MTKAGQAETLAALTETSPRSIEEAGPPNDLMLSEIAFDHPLFAPLAGAQYSDFTKIHFWKHRQFDPDTVGGCEGPGPVRERRPGGPREDDRQGESRHHDEQLETDG